MARVIIAGEPGETYTNTTGKVAYQFLCDWKNTCGQCAQYDHQVGPTWPIPLHRGCRCKQIAIWPGDTSRPFADFRDKIASLPEDQKAKVVGVANLKLIESGVVEWEDVVTGQRVRDLREVVATRQLLVEAMTAAGVAKRTAEQAYQAVHTPAHQLAAQKRAELVGKILGKGTQKDALRAALAEKLAGRVGIAAGPSGASTPPAVPKPATAPKGKPKGKPVVVPHFAGVPLTVRDRADYLLKAKVKPDVAERLSRQDATSETRAMAVALADKEAEIRSLDHERVYILDPRGNVVVRRDGGKGNVELDPEELRGKTAGNVLTHNHPNKDRPLSLADVRVGNDSGLAEMRAVTRDGSTFSLRYNGNHVPDAEFQKAFKQSFNQVSDEVDSGNLKEDGPFEGFDPDRPTHLERVATMRLAEMFGWTYLHLKR